MKNGLERIKKLAKKLNENKIPFEWQIFTNSKIAIDIDNVIVRNARLDVMNYVAQADYLVQLSDSEGYCYSIVEALSLNVPVICTDMPVLKEINVNKNNAYILNMEMTNIDVNKIYNEIPKVINYKEPTCSLVNYINKTKSTYKEENDMLHKVRALDTYKKLGLKDAVLDRIPEEGEIFEIDDERLEILTSNNPYKTMFVAELEKIETAPKESKGKKNSKKTMNKNK